MSVVFLILRRLQLTHFPFHGLAYCSVQPDQQSVTEDRGRQGEKSYNDSIMDYTTLVSQVVKIFNQYSYKIATVLRLADSSTQQSKASNEQKKVIPYRLYGIRQHLLLNKGCSGRTASILSISWRKSTHLQYEYSCRSWILWCGSKQISVFSPSTKQLLD